MPSTQENKPVFEKIMRRIIEYLPKALVAIPAFGLIIPGLFDIASGWLPESKNCYEIIYRIFTVVYFTSFPLIVLLALYVKQKNRKILKKNRKEEDYLDFIGKLKPFYIALCWIILLSVAVFISPSLFNRSNDAFHNAFIIIVAIIPPIIIYFYDRKINAHRKIVNMKLLFLGIPVLLFLSFYHWEWNTPEQFRESIEADIMAVSDSVPFTYQAIAIDLRKEMKKTEDSINLSLAKYHTGEIKFYSDSQIPIAKVAYENVQKYNNNIHSTSEEISEKHAALCSLYDASSDLARRELQPVYQQTQWRGIAILLSILLILLAYRKNGFKGIKKVWKESQDENDPDLESVQESFSKSTERTEILTVICALLIIPLLLPIKKENINIDDPAQAFKLHSWYLPSTVAHTLDYHNGTIQKDKPGCDIQSQNCPSGDLQPLRELIEKIEKTTVIRDGIALEAIYDAVTTLSEGLLQLKESAIEVINKHKKETLKKFDELKTDIQKK